MREKERDALGELDEGFLCAFMNFWRRFEVCECQIPDFGEIDLRRG